MPGPQDSFLSGIRTWIKTGKRPRASFPRAVQFQPLSVCNAHCIFCCHDWRQSVVVVVGNIVNSSIGEVWNSDQFKTLIYEYYAEKFDNLEICRNCM